MPSVQHPIVGTVRFEALSGGRIRLLNNWAEDCIGIVHIPELKGVPTYGGPFSGNVRFYKRAMPQLVACFAEIGRAGLRNDIIHWDGSFVPRMKRGSRTSPSEHTFGCAFDVNAQWNPFRTKPAAPNTKGSLWRVLPVFEKHGFESGMRWRTPDGMHQQIKRLMAAAPVSPQPTQVEAPPKPKGLIIVRRGRPVRVDTRLDETRQNWSRVRELLTAAGNEIADESEWEDGTPALFLKD